MKQFGLTLVIVALVACGESTGRIDGTVKDAAGAGIGGAEVALGDAVVQTDDVGEFSFADLEPGSVTLSAAADWYSGEEQSVTVEADGSHTADFVLDALGLEVQSADRALWESFNTSFDWTADAISFSLARAPTRAEFERVIHYRNPALYDDPSGEPQVIPTSPVSVGNTSSFNFEVAGGSQALDQATIADAATGTPLTSAELDGVFLWGPALHFLLNDWDFGAATPLETVGRAVRQQKWGGTNTLPTQRIESIFLHGDEIWVTVVFQEFVDLEADVTDTDGDGLREIFARVDITHYTAALVAELRDRYAAPNHTTVELAAILDENLNVLYPESNPSLVSAIGVPYEHADLGGTVNYPFAVIRHVRGSVINVFLVEP